MNEQVRGRATRRLRRRVAAASSMAAVALASLASWAPPAAGQTSQPPVAVVVVTNIQVTAAVTAQIPGTPPAGAQHRVLVRCVSNTTVAVVAPLDLEFLFPNSGSQSRTLNGSWTCRAVGADVPGYTSQDVGIDWAGLTGYFNWRRAPPTLPPQRTTTTAPPAVLRPAVELIGIDFGSQLSGEESAPRDAIVRNRGGIAFSVSRSETADPFTIKGGTCGAGQVAPGAECTISVTARPPNASAFERTIRVDVQSANGSARAEAALRVRGSDVENFSVGGAAFGPVNVGTQSGPQTIPVVNVGSLVARISRISVTGPFRVEPGGSCGTDVSLTPKASCTVVVVFAPGAPGDQSGTLEITAISPSKDIVATGALTGSGVLLQGQLQVTPPVVDFGRLRVGAVSPKQQVTVSNIGTAPLTVTGAGFPVAVPANRRKKTPAGTRLVPSAKGFIAVNGCRRALPPGGQCVVTVTAKPGARGEASAELRVTAAGAQGSSTMKVAGFARSIAAAPTAVAFPPTPIGTPTAPSAPVVVTNTGDEPVVIAGVTVGGAQAAELAIVSSDCPKANLAPKARCTFVVRATPGGGGARSGSVLVATETKERAGVAVRWSAQVGTLALNPPVLEYAPLDVGATSPVQPAEVRNVGKVPVVVARFDRSDPAVIITQGCVGRRLEPNQACGFTVAVKPRKAGPLSGGITVVGSGGEKASQRLRYTGKGAVTTVPPPTIPPGSVVTVPEVVTPAAPPQLVMRPTAGEIGEPATAIGTGFPADAEVTLMWADGVAAGTVRTDASGSFQKSVMPLAGLRIGPTTMTGTPVAGGQGATAPYLLQYATFQPQGRNRAIVRRG
jgi:hypothetical protein